MTINTPVIGLMVELQTALALARRQAPIAWDRDAVTDVRNQRSMVGRTVGVDHQARYAMFDHRSPQVSRKTTRDIACADVPGDVPAEFVCTESKVAQLRRHSVARMVTQHQPAQIGAWMPVKDRDSGTCALGHGHIMPIVRCLRQARPLSNLSRRGRCCTREVSRFSACGSLVCIQRAQRGFVPQINHLSGFPELVKVAGIVRNPDQDIGWIQRQLHLADPRMHGIERP